MVYSEDFKNKARALYPDNNMLHQALEDGNDIAVNNILYTSMNLHFSPEEILELVDTNPFELRRQARLMIAKNDLFKEWVEMYKANKESNK